MIITLLSQNYQLTLSPAPIQHNGHSFNMCLRIYRTFMNRSGTVLEDTHSSKRTLILKELA